MCAVHLQHIDLNLLLPLQALLEERNVTRAGQWLHLSQPAMSKHSTVREAFGDDLLIGSQVNYVLAAREALEIEFNNVRTRLVRGPRTHPPFLFAKRNEAEEDGLPRIPPERLPIRIDRSQLLPMDCRIVAPRN
jgi:hypothetical protein